MNSKIHFGGHHGGAGDFREPGARTHNGSGSYQSMPHRVKDGSVCGMAQAGVIRVYYQQPVLFFEPEQFRQSFRFIRCPGK
jgi:hypothetical protein